MSRSVNALSLQQLQNFIKRDPDSYLSEFESTYACFKTLLESFKHAVDKYDQELADMVIFIAHVSHCYTNQIKEFPESLITILKSYYQQIDPEIRLVFCKALILLRNKGLVTSLDIIQLFSQMFKCNDKLLRKTLYNFIVQDIKNLNAKNKNIRLNSKIQGFMLNIIENRKDSNSVSAKLCLDIMIELYRRNIWKDEKTVNAIASACFSKVTKMLMAALTFFLGRDEDDPRTTPESDDSDGEEKTHQQLKLAHRVGRKTKKRAKRLERQLESLKKHKKKNLQPLEFNFSAIHMLRDPQAFAERLLRQVETSKERFEVRLRMLELVSRLIGIHQLILLNFYPYLQRYLAPRQTGVTKLLMMVAQASHEMVPPDALEPLLRTIADNFISDRASSEAITVGLNAVREMCSRAPFCISAELLQDLAQYRTYRDKNVVAAARSLIGLFRQINPSLLTKKDRGRPTESQLEVKSTEFGAVRAVDYVPGAEVLAEELVGNEDEWAECSSDEDSDSDSSWINVHHSDDDIPDEVDADDSLSTVPLDEQHKKAAEVASSRIFSQEEFKRITARQNSKILRPDRKRQRQSSTDEVVEPLSSDTTATDLVSMEAITRMVKRAKQDKTERLESAAAGRNVRQDMYGYQVKRANPKASTTNREKRKSKPYQMVMHKLSRKSKKSYRDKQMAYRAALTKRLKRNKK